MEPIKYKNKEIKMGIFFALDLGTDPLKMEEVKNPYSSQSCMLPTFAVAVYDMIKGAEVTKDYGLVRQGINWFQKYFTDEYYTLLD